MGNDDSAGPADDEWREEWGPLWAQGVQLVSVVDVVLQRVDAEGLPVRQAVPAVLDELEGRAGLVLYLPRPGDWAAELRPGESGLVQRPLPFVDLNRLDEVRPFDQVEQLQVLRQYLQEALSAAQLRELQRHELGRLCVRVQVPALAAVETPGERMVRQLGELIATGKGSIDHKKGNRFPPEFVQAACAALDRRDILQERLAEALGLGRTTVLGKLGRNGKAGPGYASGRTRAAA